MVGPSRRAIAECAVLLLGPLHLESLLAIVSHLAGKHLILKRWRKTHQRAECPQPRGRLAGATSLFHHLGSVRVMARELKPHLRIVLEAVILKRWRSQDGRGIEREMEVNDTSRGFEVGRLGWEVEAGKGRAHAGVLITRVPGVWNCERCLGHGRSEVGQGILIATLQAD